MRGLIDIEIGSGRGKKSDINRLEIRRNEARKGREERDVWQGTCHDTPEQSDWRMRMP